MMIVEVADQRPLQVWDLGSHPTQGELGQSPRITLQELLGPVAMVFKAASEQEAVQIANDVPFGLGFYLFTTDRAQAERVVDRIEAGMVFVNGVLLDGAELPFGGIKGSGFGRELGRYGIDEFVNKKLIRVLK
jgi:succinate-semialdehyde dehydrogenase/glutarate-semialdehyde dehydrogenase